MSKILNRKTNIKLLVLIGITIILINNKCFAQENLFYGQIDTIVLKSGDRLFLTDTSILYPNDTTIYVPLELQYRIKRNPVVKSENFYKKLEDQASYNKLTKKLYHSVFRLPASSAIIIKNGNNLERIRHAKYQGRRIKSISINKLQVFGSSVYDTTRLPVTLSAKTGNKLHFNTRTRIIKNSLLFKEGDVLKPIDLEDTERILRSLPYIRDARIYVSPDISGENVNITVVTQDLWTLGGEVEITDINSAVIDLYSKNIMGLGHQQLNTLYYDSENSNYNGYNGYYRTNNTFGKFIKSELNYYNRYNTEILSFSVSRDFYTPSIKYAGGLRVSQTGLPPVTMISADKSIIESLIKYDYRDIWIARGFNLKQTSIQDPHSSRLIIAGRILSKSFIERPEVFADSNLTYYNYNTFLGSIGISKRNYHKGNLIYNYGRTEDIPYGFLVKLTLGTRIDDFNTRPYSSLSISNGFFSKKHSYYYMQLSTGGYFKDNIIEEGIINFNGTYFTPIKKIGDYNLRNFFNVDLNYGFNRLDSEFLDINKDHGIRDFVADNITGTNRIRMSMESVLFTPIYFMAFRFVLFGFVDIAAVGNTLDFVFTEKYYSGIGLGLRIRNDNLVFRAFELKFTFFPEMPTDRPQTVYLFTNERPITFNDYSIGAPGIIRYE